MHSEPQTHAWAPPLIGSDGCAGLEGPRPLHCAPAPHTELGQLSLCEAALAGHTLPCASVVKAEAPWAGRGEGGPKGGQVGGCGPKGWPVVPGQLAWGPEGGLRLGPSWPPVLGRSLPVLASLSQMWGLVAMIPQVFRYEPLLVTACSGELSES